MIDAYVLLKKLDAVFEVCARQARFVGVGRAGVVGLGAGDGNRKSKRSDQPAHEGGISVRHGPKQGARSVDKGRQRLRAGKRAVAAQTYQRLILIERTVGRRGHTARRTGERLAEADEPTLSGAPGSDRFGPGDI